MIIYPFKEEKSLLKISQPLIIFIVIGYTLKFLTIDPNTNDIFNFVFELLILGYLYIFANNIINNVVPAVPNFLQDFLRIIKHGFIGTWVINIYIAIFGIITLPITLFLASINMIQVMYLILILVGILIVPLAFCMYSYKLSFKESLKIKNIKTAFKTIWNIKFLYLKYLFIAILLTSLSFLLGIIIYVVAPIAEEIHADSSIFLVGLEAIWLKTFFKCNPYHCYSYNIFCG